MTTHTTRSLVALAITTLLAACGSSNGDTITTASDKPATPVRVETVIEAPLSDAIRGVGLLAPKDEVRLSFKVGGVVSAIRVEEGASIRKGQVLAILEQTEVGAAVEQARQAAEKARRDLDRGKALFADGVAAEEQVQDLTTAYRVAQANLRSAEFNARFARIEAPNDGIVLRRLAEPNELVQPGQPVLIVGGSQRGWVVRTAMADRDVVQLKVGDRADITLDAYPGRTFAARVTEISSSADPMTGTFNVELTVDTGDVKLAQGLVAKVALPRDARAANGVAVPVSSLLEANAGGATVFVVDADGTARRLSVRTGRLIGERVEITGGIEPGARIVVDGASYLEDGSAVDVLKDG